METKSMTHICKQEGSISGLEHDVSNLVRWQKSQNGTIHRVEEKANKIDEKVDNMKTWIMTQAITFIITLMAGLVLYIINMNK